MRCAFAILLASVFVALPVPTVDAGEIVEKTYYNSKGDAVSGYVYQAGSSRRSYSRSRDRYRYGGCDYGYASWPLRVYSRTYVHPRVVRHHPHPYRARPVVPRSRSVRHVGTRRVVTGGRTSIRGGVTVIRR